MTALVGILIEEKSNQETRQKPHFLVFFHAQKHAKKYGHSFDYLIDRRDDFVRNGCRFDNFWDCFVSLQRLLPAAVFTPT